MSYNVDIVMGIDATGSMSHIIDEVKNNAIKLHGDLQSFMESQQKTIDQLRVKVLFFRDIFVDEPAFFESKFFHLPEEESEFKSFVSDMKADGGGDEPESGLEALSKAINCDWDTSSDSSRQVIAIWTDASAHELEVGHEKGVSGDEIPKNINELTGHWGQNMQNSSKRLLMFAPNVYPWSSIGESWDQTIHYESTAGDGLSEVNYEEIIKVLAKSIS